MARQFSWQHLVKPVALTVAYFACLAGMVYLMDRVETARAEARVIGWTQSLVWETLDAPAYARFTQPIIEPTKGTGWNLSGEIRVPDKSGTFVAQPYRAKVRIVCSPSRNRECWELTGLSVGESDLAENPRASTAAPTFSVTAPAVAAEPAEDPQSEAPTSSPTASSPTASSPTAPGASATNEQDLQGEPAPKGQPEPPHTAVAILEERLSTLRETPDQQSGSDPFGASGFRHAGIDDLRGLDKFADNNSESLGNVFAVPISVPDGYPPIPIRKPL